MSEGLKYKYGFIGIGNMGFAMMQSAVKAYGTEVFSYTDVNQERLDYVKSESGVDYVLTNEACINNSDIVVLAIKPQYIDAALAPLENELFEGKVVISIAPGVTSESLGKYFVKSTKIVRAMPNTPAMIGEGVSALAFTDDSFSEEEKEDILRLFNTFGEAVVVTEHQLDMVVPISGSSPAYVYMFIEAMADAGVLMGLPRDISYKLAANAVKGSASMVAETGLHPGVLKDQVTSPGGTTIAAVKSLEKNGFRGTVIEAMDACYKRTKELGNS